MGFFGGEDISNITLNFEPPYFEHYNNVREKQKLYLSSFFSSVRPAITSNMSRDLPVATGQDIILKVNFEGTPPPSIKWTKHGKKIQKAQIKEGETSSELMISAAVPSDAGTYQISLKNDAGSVKASCNVAVQGKSF